MTHWRTRLFTNLAALILGALLTLSFAPYGLFPLAIFCPLGLLLLWRNTTAREACLLGFLFGLGFYGTGVYWVYISMHFFGGVPVALSILFAVVFVSYLALFPSLSGYALQRFFPKPTTINLTLAFPAIWVFSEWARSFLFTGFPWLFLGYSQTNSPLRGYAPLLSVYAVSLTTLMTSGLLLSAYEQLKTRNGSLLNWRFLACLGLWIVGSLFAKIPWTHPQGDPINISLVQGNIPQSIKWSPQHLQLSLNRYESLTKPLWAKNHLIIWPEAAVPLPLQEAQDYIEKLDEQAKAADATLVLGIPIQAEDNLNYYNAIITLGAEHDLYLKRHLVPFGEYTPFLNVLFPLLSFMDIPMSDLISGKMQQPFLKVNGIKILSSICYEIGFPELMHTADKTVGMLLTITNDAWFGKSAAQAQHFQMAIMRAIELQRPVIALGNDGISAIITPEGKVKSIAPSYEVAVLNTTVQARSGLTPWMRNGMDPMLVILVLFLVVATLKARSDPSGIKEHQLINDENPS